MSAINLPKVQGPMLMPGCGGAGVHGLNVRLGSSTTPRSVIRSELAGSTTPGKYVWIGMRLFAGSGRRGSSPTNVRPANTGTCVTFRLAAVASSAC
jgi:hypothetical protein